MRKLLRSTRRPVTAQHLTVAILLFLPLAGCSSDNPAEPEPAAITPEHALTATAVGNITDLGTLGGDEAIAGGINSNGDVVGTISKSGLRHAFLWRSSTGTVTHLDATTAEDVNAGRKVVGGIPAYSWQNGTLTQLPTEVGPDCSSTTFAFAVNTSGHIVGQSQNASCDTEPVLWKDGTVQALGDLGSGFGRAWDINDDGWIVGYSSPHGFLWRNGTMRSLGTLGGEYSEAYGINNIGHVVGDSYHGAFSESHAFLWVNGSMTDLGTLGGPTSFARDVNDNGQVVGYSTTANGRTHAFWWERGVMSDLGTLGGDRMVAWAVNNLGQVAGESNVVPRGPAHAVRWTIPTANYWSARAAIGLERRGHAVAASSGLLYAIGGENRFNNVVSTVQAYNPAANKWSTKAPLPVGRQSANGATTINSIIYVAGGLNPAGKLTNTLYAYNPATNRWLGQRNLPVPGGCGGSAAIGGKLYSFSGCRLVNGAQQPAGLLHRYDPATNSWATLPSAPAVHFQPAVAAVGGKLYVAGGSNAAGAATSRLDVYDPATNTWATRSPMPAARVASSAVSLGGKLYVLGGRNGDSYLDAVHRYDPAANAWSTRAPMITARAGLGAGVLGPFIYAVAGRNRNKLFVVNERHTP